MADSLRLAEGLSQVSWGAFWRRCSSSTEAAQALESVLESRGFRRAGSHCSCPASTARALQTRGCACPVQAIDTGASAHAGGLPREQALL